MRNRKMEFCTSELAINFDSEVQITKNEICTGAKSKNRVLHLRIINTYQTLGITVKNVPLLLQKFKKFNIFQLFSRKEERFS